MQLLEVMRFAAALTALVVPSFALLAHDVRCSRRALRCPAPVAMASLGTAEGKRVAKLRQALKHIGKLRLADYMALTTAQRVKVHREPAVLEELRSLSALDESLVGPLAGADVEALRQRLQPGLPKPMPPSRPWSPERDERRREAVSKREAAGRTSPGDWTCPECGTSSFARRTECFGCGRPRDTPRAR